MLSSHLTNPLSYNWGAINYTRKGCIDYSTKTTAANILQSKTCIFNKITKNNRNLGFINNGCAKLFIQYSFNNARHTSLHLPVRMTTCTHTFVTIKAASCKTQFYRVCSVIRAIELTQFWLYWAFDEHINWYHITYPYTKRRPDISNIQQHTRT